MTSLFSGGSVLKPGIIEIVHHKKSIIVGLYFGGLVARSYTVFYKICLYIICYASCEKSVELPSKGLQKIASLFKDILRLD